MICNTTLTSLSMYFLFFFNDTAPTEIYTLSLHDALPIYRRPLGLTDFDDGRPARVERRVGGREGVRARAEQGRSEEHTSELQSHHDLVCRLLLEKKNQSQRTSHLKPIHTQRRKC